MSEGGSGRVVSVSVDLDPIECYWRIHALPGAPPERARHAILRRCLPRFAELFARHGVRATLFVVARDLEEDAEGRALLAQLARDGHELASHTYSHPYDLVRLPDAAIASEIDLAHGLIGACGGAAPCGLRRHLVASALRAPFFNLELHGIDLADAEADEIPPALVAKQPDLRRPLAHKLAALDETLAAARVAGARFRRLDEVAADLR